MEALMDGNVYIYRAVRNSNYHVEAWRLLEEFSAWVAPTLVLHEVVWALHELLGLELTLGQGS